MTTKKKSSPHARMKKPLPVILSTALFTLSLTAASPVQAVDSPSAIIKSSASDDMKWVSNLPDQSQAYIELTPGAQFTNLLNPASLQMTADSSKSTVAAVDLDNVTQKLKLIINGQGDAVITLTAKDATDLNQPTLVDTFKVNITKLGDTTGDGFVTPADALFIVKLVNSKAPLTPLEILKYDINGDGFVTSADSTELLSKYVNKQSSSNAQSYIANLTNVDDTPLGYQLKVQGTAAAGQTVSALYAYYDADQDLEGTPSFQWYRSNNANGSDKTAISGAVDKDYTVTHEDEGYYLFFEATLQNAMGKTGALHSRASGFVPDSTPPLLTSTLPYVRTDKLKKSDIMPFAFNENVQAGSGQIHIRKKSEPAQGISINASDSKIIISGSTVSLINLNLDETTDYYLEIDPGAFEDASGNAFAGISGTSSWTFATADETAPQALTFVPANQMQGASVSEDLRITFNEEILPVAGKKITVTDAVYDTSVDYPVNDASQVMINGSTVSIKHAAFQKDRAYYVTIEAGAFTDASGNEIAGLTDSSAWSFVTADGRSLNAVPYTSNGSKITETEIRNNNGTIQLTISDDIFKETLTAADFNVTNAPPGVTVTEAIYMDSTSAIIYLQSDGTNFDETYSQVTVTVAGSALMSGKPISSNGVTVEGELESTIVSLSPVTQSSDSKRWADLVLQLQANVSAVSGKNVYIYEKAGDVLVETIHVTDSNKVVVSGSTVTIRHNALKSSTEYYVVIDAGAFTDQNGRDFEGISSKTQWAFTTKAANEASPFISDFLDGGNHDVVVQIIWKGPGSINGTDYELYSVINGELHPAKELGGGKLFDLNVHPVQIIMDPAYYDLFDDYGDAFPNKYFYTNNEMEMFSGNKVSAIILKKNGEIIDILGDPTSNAPLLPNGGTLIRKPGMKGGSSTFDSVEWDYKPYIFFGSLIDHIE